MSTNKIIQLNEGMIKQELKELVRNSVEETINGLLDKEAKALTNAENSSQSSKRFFAKQRFIAWKIFQLQSSRPSTMSANPISSDGFLLAAMCSNYEIAINVIHSRCPQ